MLITLGIIGIVAALTMPALVANYQEKATVVKLKKFYSVISQAYAMAEQEYGDPTGWDLRGISEPAGAKNMAEKFRPYLKVINDGKFCSDGNHSYCYTLADGSNMAFWVNSADCTNYCGHIELYLKDTMELSEKGVSRFAFGVYKTGIEPRGLPPVTTCLTTPDARQYCTGWVLTNENMDYLHCDDLSWGGKTRCN